jgi:pyruvate/2-oxoglutarate dehydrogenase complex dihydrolipoamide acyltransferase (E2) component
MGDSITEGTIAAVLKSEGASVNEDEPIAQIETDKITIDVRAPKTGVVESIKVKVEDTVTVGQTVASVNTEGGAKASKDETPQQNQQPKDSEASAAEQPKQQEAPQQDTHAPKRTPGIKFPRRVTDSGDRISSLPAAEQEKLLKELGLAAPSHAKQPDTQQADAKAVEAPKKEAPRPTKQQTATYEGFKYKPYAGKERGTKLSTQHVLSQREIDAIETGGADP